MRDACFISLAIFSQLYLEYIYFLQFLYEITDTIHSKVRVILPHNQLKHLFLVALLIKYFRFENFILDNLLKLKSLCYNNIILSANGFH